MGSAQTRNVKALAWVSCFQDAASEMFYPVLPLFVTTPLRPPFAAVGLIEGEGVTRVRPRT